MDPKLQRILQKYKPGFGEEHVHSLLKENLGLDSMSLIQIAMDIHHEFGVDLGEEAEKGISLATAADIEKCLKAKA